jgi:protein-tyrosine phosphatase
MPAGPVPDFGVYLVGKDPGAFEWEHRWVRCGDFRTPSSTEDAVSALRDAYERAAAERVEVACGGGVGRTGMGLAAMAVFAGIPPQEAVAWVRTNYDHRAVETPWQRRWIERRVATVD